MTNGSTREIPFVKSTTVGIVSGALAAVTMANQVSQLAALYRDVTGTLNYDDQSDEEKGRDQLEKQRHITTGEWLTSEEHENSVLVNIQQASMSKSIAVKKLHQLYQRNSDILGIRSIGPCLNIVFANAGLMNQVLLNGFQIDSITTLYPTKTLNADYNHTLLTFKGLPISSMDVTKQKIEQSLAPLLENAIGNDVEDKQNWPPVIHDYLFHQKPFGFYSGILTVILRGKFSPTYRRTLQLDGFRNKFACKVEHCPMYCRRCKKMGSHKTQECPSISEQSRTFSPSLYP